MTHVFDQSLQYLFLLYVVVGSVTDVDGSWNVQIQYRNIMTITNVIQVLEFSQFVLNLR